MNPTPSAPPTTLEDRFQEAAASYLRAVDAGQSPNPDELLARYPDVADRLREFLKDQERLRNLTGTQPAAPPRSFGDYELLEEIAPGGMGVVYRARQVSLNRIVALKMIRSGDFATPAEVQRFRTEAEAVAKLDHPNIVPIYEVGEHASMHFFSMKFLDGGSLTGWIKKNLNAEDAEKSGEKREASTESEVRTGAPPTRFRKRSASRFSSLRSSATSAVKLISTVSRAVHHAHQRQILHRDLKPANILLDSHGEPHVADFGLAKRIPSSPPYQASSSPPYQGGAGGSELTRTGAILGTPSYMAPEQARAEKSLSTAVDVYSLGAILYEVLTGRPPFRGDSALVILRQVIDQDPVPPRRLDPGVDRDLETICLTCLEKDPAKRYGSAEALADELDRYHRGEPILRRPVSRVERAWRWCKRKPVVAGLGTAALISVVAGTMISTFFGIRANEKARLATNAANEEQTQRKRAENGERTALEALDLMSSRLIDDWLAKQRELTPDQRAFLDWALTFYERFTAEAGERPRHRWALGSAYSRVGIIRKRLGRTAEAETALHRAIDILGQAHAESGESSGVERDLAAALHNLAEILCEQRRFSEAVPLYEQAISRQTGVAKEAPTDEHALEFLANHHDGLSAALDRLKRRRGAESHVREAILLRRQLVAKSPKDASRQTTLAGSLHNLAVIVSNQGKLEESISLFREAIPIQQAAADLMPHKAEAGEFLVNHYYTLGIVLYEAGRAEEAEKSLRDASTASDRLSGRFPGVPGYRHQRMRCHLFLATIEEALDKDQDAEKELHNALAIVERLKQGTTGVVEYDWDLGLCYRSLGQLSGKRGDSVSGLAFFGKAVEHFQVVAQKQPALGRNSLQGAYCQRAKLLERLRRYAEALKDWERSIELDVGTSLQPHLGRAACLLRLGKAAEAVAVVDELARTRKVSAGEFYDAACIYAVAASAADGEPVQTRAYSDRALALLKQAVQKGFNDTEHIKADPDLTSLRSRDDFKKLVAELEEKLKSQRAVGLREALERDYAWPLLWGWPRF